MNNFDERYRHVVTLLEITGLTHKELAEQSNLDFFRFGAINLKERKEKAVSFLELHEKQFIDIELDRNNLFCLLDRGNLRVSGFGHGDHYINIKVTSNMNDAAT